MLDAKHTVFCLCDMQEKFAPAIDGWEGICESASRLCEGSRLLEIPLIVSEQYPKGLGNTVPQLSIQHAYYKFEKTQFSMLSDVVKEKIDAAVREKNAEDPVNSSTGKKQVTVVLFGVETHVCILQTALSLLHEGYAVQVVADAVSSRNASDRKLAYMRLQNAGVVLSSVEAVLFELVRTKDHPRFREIQALIKTAAPSSNLLSAL